MSSTTVEWLLLAAVIGTELAAFAVWIHNRRRERLRHVSWRTLERLNNRGPGPRGGA